MVSNGGVMLKVMSWILALSVILGFVLMAYKT